MLGHVSPIVLNTLKSKRSPGIDRFTSPAVFIAPLNTSPEAPDSSVRSRSKNAAPRCGVGGGRAGEGIGDIVGENGKGPAWGKRDLSTEEPRCLGEHPGGF